MVLSPHPNGKSDSGKWLKAGFIEKNALTPTEEGTPQGGPLSPVIANMALDGRTETDLESDFHRQRRKTATEPNTKRRTSSTICGMTLS